MPNLTDKEITKLAKSFDRKYLQALERVYFAADAVMDGRGNLRWTRLGPLQDALASVPIPTKRVKL